MAPAIPSTLSLMRPLRLSLAALAAGLLLTLAVLPGRPAVALQQTAAVAVGDFFYCDPSQPPGGCQTVVTAGDTVAWDYRTGNEGHTVTHCGVSCDAPTAAPDFDSGRLKPGESFSFQFVAPGTYLYYCQFHPVAMRASVVVQPAPTAAPTAPPAPTEPPAPAPTLTQSPAPQPPTPRATPSPTPARSTTPGATPLPARDAAEDGGGGATWLIVAIALAAAAALAAGGWFALQRRRR